MHGETVKFLLYYAVIILNRLF